MAGQGPLLFTVLVCIRLYEEVGAVKTLLFPFVPVTYSMSYRMGYV